MADRPSLYLGIEYALLFWGLPALLAFTRIRVPKLLVLLFVAALCTAALLRDPTFDRTLLWNTRGFRQGLPAVLLIFLATAPVLTAAVVLRDRPAFLGFVRAAPAFWALVMALYPLVSVYPQELIYRAFLFHRYQRLFASPAALTWASAAAFGWVHIVYGSAVSVLLSLAGGYLFAVTYQRTGSLLLCSLQHALYGDLIFTVGLGRYFYRGHTF